jgi:hypothetical protein
MLCFLQFFDKERRHHAIFVTLNCALNGHRELVSVKDPFFHQLDEFFIRNAKDLGIDIVIVFTQQWRAP